VAERLTVTGPGGRVLEVHADGPGAGRALLIHTGTPSAGTLDPSHERAAAERGVRRISYARPGYAASARHPGRVVADCVQDVVAVADALGVERFMTVGASGGGPHALACAALLPERVLAAATIGGVAPWGVEGLDWLAGMGPENHEEFHAALAGEGELLAYLEAASQQLAGADGPSVAGALGELVSDVDRAAITGAFADHLAADMRASVSTGPWGWLDDDLECIRDWGFPPARITRPVTIWHGGEDRFVPFSHGEWLATHIPAATPRLLPGEGHFSLLVSRYDEILDQLLLDAG
jgi:pimeloyl-ACP methyl ester carboxylesterase